MYIKVKKNQSGSVSVWLMKLVRITGKKTPVPQMVKRFGVAHTEEETNLLKAVAGQYLATLPQRREEKELAGDLVIERASDIESCLVENRGFRDVYGHLFEQVFNDTGLKSKGNQLLSQLVVMRIADPKSKRSTAKLSGNFGYEMTVDSIYKLMDRMDDTVIERIKQISYEECCRLLSKVDQILDVLFYDLTTLYFETNTQDDLREFGFSKDGKHQHVQIVMAMLVTREGLPIGYELFPGNTYEGHTLIPVIANVRQRYKIGRVIVIADSGLINKKNTQQLDEAGLEYVIGGRIKSSSQAEIKAALDEDGYKPLNQEGVKGKIYKVPVKEAKECKEFLMIYHSEKRVEKDAYERDRAVAKIQKHLGASAKQKLGGVLRKSYVSLTKESQIALDQEKLTDAAKLDGYFSLQTNIKHSTPEEILEYYSGLWQIEQTFRITKYNLRLRPVFHYNVRRIKAHFALCYIALTLVRTLEFKMRLAGCYLPVEQLHAYLHQLSTVKITTNKQQRFYVSTDMPPALITFYQCLKMKDPPRFLKR
jgi:transposase